MSTVIDQQELMSQATGFDPDNDASLFMSDMVDFFIKNIETVPPWWSRQRDATLRGVWKDGNYGSAMTYLAQTKIASIPMKVVAKDQSITAHVKQAESLTKAFEYNSGFGAGWYDELLKYCEDYLCQDNGSFMEVLGAGPSTGAVLGIPAGVKHLDSARCTRTGNPEFPVKYLGDDGIEYKMHYARVFFQSQMPSPKASMNNVGFSSISRSLRILQNLLHIVDHKDEKMGARAASQILVGSGITGKEIIKAIAAAESMMSSLGLEHYARTIALGSTDGSIDLEKVDLNNFDPFNEETSNTFAAYALALAWGLEFQEVIPLASSKVSEIVSLQRSRAKLPHLYTTTFEQQANLKLVPQHLEMHLDFQDDQEDQQRAVIEDITSRNFQRQMDSGVTTPEVVQEIFYERGYLSKEMLRSMKLSRGVLQDGSPVQSLFFHPNYTEFLRIPREYLVTRVSDVEIALTEIEANQVYIYGILGGTRSSDQIHKALESLAALEWLKYEYTPQMFEEGEEEEEEEEDEEEGNPPERRGVGEGGAEEKGLYPTTSWFRGNHDLVWRDI